MCQFAYAVLRINFHKKCLYHRGMNANASKNIAAFEYFVTSIRVNMINQRMVHIKQLNCDYCVLYRENQPCIVITSKFTQNMLTRWCARVFVRTRMLKLIHKHNEIFKNKTEIRNWLAVCASFFLLLHGKAMSRWHLQAR